MSIALSFAEARRAAGIATPLLAPIVLVAIVAPAPKKRRGPAAKPSERSKRREPSETPTWKPQPIPRSAPLPPPTAPVLAAPVPAAEVVNETDRFRCAPYNAVLLASACARRQEKLGQPRTMWTPDYFLCGDCKDGPLIKLRLQRAPTV